MPWRPTASPPGSAKKTSNQATTTYLDSAFTKEEVDNNRRPLLDFATRVEMLPIAVAVGASLLRDQAASALGRAVLKLQLGRLTDGAKDVNALFRTAIESQPAREQRLLAACAVCVQEGFWLPLAAQIAELSEEEADEWLVKTGWKNLQHKPLSGPFSLIVAEAV